MAVELSRDQQNAVDACGGSVLVSAAAGSGKTSVLTHRVLRLAAEQGIDMERLLVVTFTNAAAEEMRSRIYTGLYDAMLKNPSALLRRQLLMVHAASISTIHAFCLNILREHLSLPDLPPDFQVGEEGVVSGLRTQALSETLEEFYKGEEAQLFSELAAMLGNGRSDHALSTLLLSLQDFLGSEPFPEDWLIGKEQLFYLTIPLEESPFGKILLRYLTQGAAYHLNALQKALSRIGEEEALYERYGEEFRRNASFAEELLRLAESGDFDGAYYLVHDFSFEKLPSYRGDSRCKDAVALIRNAFKEYVADLSKGPLSFTSAEYREDLAVLAPQISLIFKALRRFLTRFTQKKRAQGILDFSDIEQLTVSLLLKKNQQGDLVKTVLAEQISQGYEEILIDEFQDTNQTQDLIFRAVSKEENNLFLVGDIKQSIYRFRQAMPEIFLEKKERFAPFDGQTYPCKIFLSENYRSRSGITDFINLIFSRLMSRDAAELDYTHEEWLYPKAAYPEQKTPAVSLMLVSDPSGESQEDPFVRQAREVGKRILQLMGKDSTKITGRDGEMRSPLLSDIAILLRSPKGGKASVFREELQKLGIATVAAESEDFYSRREIALFLNLLRAINNPREDIPLLSVLLSPLFSVTADDIALIRERCKKGPLITALYQTAADIPVAARVVEQLRVYRRLSGVLPCDRLIMWLYRETNFPEIACASENRAQSKAALQRLVQKAKEFCEGFSPSLSSFLRYINKAAESGAAGVSLSNGEQEAVRILSIHSSKGLEFPICFVCDLQKGFNLSDLYGTALIHKALGFSIKRFEPSGLKSYTTAMHEAIKISSRFSQLSEEMRVLYVALTRAREQLFLVGEIKNPREKLQRIAASTLGETQQIIPYRVQEAASFLDWILMALVSHPDFSDLIPEAISDKAQKGTLEVCLLTPGEGEESETPSVEEKALPANPGLITKVVQQVSQPYPYQDILSLPSKLSVSDITKKTSDPTALPKPQFSDTARSATDVGNAYHHFFWLADFKNPLEEELFRLEQKEFMSRDELALLDKKKLQTFLDSPLCKRINESDKVMKEYKLFFEVSASELFEELCCDKEEIAIPVQGVADCIFFEGDRLILTDYKSDRITALSQLKERYEGQLLLYRTALQKSFPGKQITGILYSVYLGEELQMF